MKITNDTIMDKIIALGFFPFITSNKISTNKNTDCVVVKFSHVSILFFACVTSVTAILCKDPSHLTEEEITKEPIEVDLFRASSLNHILSYLERN